MTKFKIMCVQPIKICSQLYSEVLKSTKNREVISNFLNKNNEFKVPWLERFTNDYHKFKSFRSLDGIIEPSEIKEYLKGDLIKAKYEIGGNSLSKYILIDETSYDVLFDVRFFYFIIIYEIHFSIPEQDCLQLLSCGIESNDLKTDFYNTIRRMLVQECDSDEISDWASKIRSSTIARILELSALLINNENLSNLSLLASPLKLVDIRNNTGNITLFVNSSPKNLELKAALNTCNKMAEFSKKEPEIVFDNDDLSYMFFGRFHTIITTNETLYVKYFPIQFHLQYLWYISSFFIELLDDLNHTLLILNDDTDFKNQSELIDEYINKIEMLVMHNESFKLTIESDNSLVFNKIAKIWNVENCLKNAKGYVIFFKEYLNRGYNRRQEKSNKRQNNILFIISCMQIIAMISVWNDYFDMQTKNYVSWFMVISAWLPIALSFLILWLVYLVYKKRDN